MPGVPHPVCAPRHVSPRVGRSLARAIAGVAAPVCGALLLAAPAGCASPSSGSAQGVNNGLANMDLGPTAEQPTADELVETARAMSDDELADRFAWQSDAWAEYEKLKNGEQPGAVVAGDLGAEGAANGSDPLEVSADADPADTEEEIAEVPVEEPEVDPETRARALASELEALIRETTDDPYALAIRLAGLLAGEPDAAGRLEALTARLPADQRGVVNAVAAILAEVGTDPTTLTEALVERADELNEARPVRIGTLALCSRVEGFGRYNELPSTGFVAGSPIRMIVYTEVEHFDRRPIADRSDGSYSGPTKVRDGWEVRLSQELQLYHESDGLLAWRRPEEVTAYRSRSKIRDYFIVDQITLPRTLTVGAYRLKVVLRDLADRSVDERIIPIRIVADPELATNDATIFGGN